MAQEGVRAGPLDLCVPLVVALPFAFEPARRMVARYRAVNMVFAQEGVRAGPLDTSVPLGCEAAVRSRACQGAGSPLADS